MDNKENNTYFEAKDPEGNEIICPVDKVDREKVLAGDVDDENCLEKDVAGRYAADIRIES